MSLPFLPDLHVEVEKEWEGVGKEFFLAFIGFSILVMLTLRGCVKMAMRGCRCPLWKRREPAIFLWARHPLSRLHPCHLSPSFSLKWQGICSSRSDHRFVAHYAVLQAYQTDLVQGSRFFIIRHIHNHTGYNQW